MKKKKHPNILLLYSDQHNARVLGCYGNNEVHTPNIDRLAAEGVRFENAYTQNPICTPSRMCIMSGQYPHNFGYYGLMGKKPGNLPHIFQYLKVFGYKTGMAGKIHTPSGWLSDYCDYVGDGYGYEEEVKPWNEKKLEGLQGMKGDDYSNDLYGKGLLANRDDKFIHEWFEKHGYSKSQGMDSRFSRLDKNETIEAWSAEKTNDFIEKCHLDEVPFCFWMTVPRPHSTYVPAKEFWDMYDENKLTLPPNSENKMEGRHPSAKRTQEGWQKSNDWRIFKPDDWESARRRIMKGYYACVSQVDDAVGRVLDKLDELGIREETIIVYATDHGEFAGEHGMIEKAPGIGFRCVTRIPYIWSWKGHLKEGEIRDSLVESVDFLPTVCALAGIPAPDWVDGKDICKVFDHNFDIRDIAVTENPYTKTVHSKKYKLTQYLPDMCEGKDFGELFDMEKDPWELNNLYFMPEYQPILQELRLKLYCWTVRTTRNVTVNPSALDCEGNMVSWDLAEGVYSQDGKLSFKIAEDMIKSGKLNYL